MARARLRDCSPPLQGKALEAARRLGTVTILTNVGTNATVYSAETGTGTLTNTSIRYNARLDSLEGWVDAGEFQISVGGYTQPIEVHAGDGVSSHAFYESVFSTQKAVMNFPFEALDPAASATTTNQTISFVRVRPKRTMNAITVVSAVKTAATSPTAQIALYSSDGTTLTRQSIGSALTTGLYDTANTLHRTSISASATAIVYGGKDYYVGILVQSGTPGAMYGYATTIASQPTLSTPEMEAPMYTLATQTALPASTAISGLTASFNLIPWVAITE